MSAVAKEAKLVVICCSKASNGRRHWTLQLLADRLVELNIVDSVSYETVRRTPDSRPLRHGSPIGTQYCPARELPGRGL